MKVVRYRIWNEEHKEWMEPSDFIIEYGGNIRSVDNSIDINKITIMYSTTLFDNNGKEIYEDDIVSVKLPMGGFLRGVTEIKFGVIKYNKNLGGFVVRWNREGKEFHIPLDQELSNKITIIGNRIENKMTTQHIETGIFN